MTSMRETVPKAVQDCHDLLRWLIPHLDKFPRARRFTLGERLEAGLLDVLAELVDAAYRRDKTQALRRANRRLQVEFGGLRERMAKLEELLEGLREAITKAQGGLNRLASARPAG